jgi:primosomal protein N' (replication factor Y)
LLISVAVPVPGLDLLTYSAPDEPSPAIGARVVVPLGSRTVTGIVIDVGVDAPGVEQADIKAIRRLLDDEAFLAPDLIALARWTAEYYAAGAGEAVVALLPPMTRGDRASAHKTVRLASITAAGLEVRAAGDEAGLTVKQREALDALSGTPDGVPTGQLAARGFAADVIKRLAAHGWIALRQERVDRDPFQAASYETPSAPSDRQLTGEQVEALDRLARMAGDRSFQVALLHGVTGSGKTEIFVRLSEIVRASGRQVLVLVPEIALTPAMSAQFRRSFADGVAILHSGLSDGERHDEWQRIRRGQVQVVVGTRSAAFAPLTRVGLIVIDEEHDTSYKQDESPRYHGRDVAVMRGLKDRALVVLASATPAMETYHNALSGRYQRVVLERRVGDRPLPAVTVVDMREEYAQAGSDVVLSRALIEALGRRLDRREQALVLLNRRGFATAVFCRQCAGTMDCPNCSVSLVVHGEGASRRARCHYCNYSVRVPTACPLCAGPYLDQAGFGTERVEAEITRAFPAARVARLDRDSVRRKGSLTALLQRFQHGEIDVMVGTQMIAKGHDFPRVTLVGVISADVGLGLADFRASERTFQLLTQVAGRAGRGDQPGEAIIQTLYPDHYSIQLACRQDYVTFYQRELQYRRAMRYPPAVALINAIVRARTFAGAMDDAADIAARLRRDAASAHLHVLGPAPAPLGKLRGEYRAQLLIKGFSRRTMRQALQRALASRTDLQRRVVVDVDPVAIL